MKKIILLALAVLVLVAMVACGGETTTASTTTTEPASTNGPTQGGTTTDGGDDIVDPPTTGSILFPDYPDAINLMSGEQEYMMIDAYKFGDYPFAFENHHAGLNYNWCVVVAAYEVESLVNEMLLDYNEETGLAQPYDTFKWVLLIDDQPVEITNFYNSIKTTHAWVRMDLGADWEWKEDGHEYDLKLKICDAATDEVLYYAWLTDPDFGDKYAFSVPAPIEMVPDPNGGATENEIQLENGVGKQVSALNGPDGASATELFGNVFDGRVETKLCTSVTDVFLEFALSDAVWNGGSVKITSISIVGANDDEKFANRAISKFVLMGKDDGGEWTEVLSVDKRDTFGDPVNYGERHYVIPEGGTSYQYYMLKVLDVPVEEAKEKTLYQLSEILLYASKDSMGLS